MSGRPHEDPACQCEPCRAWTIATYGFYVVPVKPDPCGDVLPLADICVCECGAWRQADRPHGNVEPLTVDAWLQTNPDRCRWDDRVWRIERTTRTGDEWLIDLRDLATEIQILVHRNASAVLLSAPKVQ